MSAFMVERRLAEAVRAWLDDDTAERIGIPKAAAVEGTTMVRRRGWPIVYTSVTVIREDSGEVRLTVMDDTDTVVVSSAVWSD